MLVLFTTGTIDMVPAQTLQKVLANWQPPVSAEAQHAKMHDQQNVLLLSCNGFQVASSRLERSRSPFATVRAAEGTTSCLGCYCAHSPRTSVVLLSSHGGLSRFTVLKLMSEPAAYACCPLGSH